jgi:hypothetical protein
MAEWPVVAMKSGNADGAKGHAEFNFFDHEVRQGRHDKTFHRTARTEAKDIP